MNNLSVRQAGSILVFLGTPTFASHRRCVGVPWRAGAYMLTQNLLQRDGPQRSIWSIACIFHDFGVEYLLCR